mgnify:CR=1 FL=1
MILEDEECLSLSETKEDGQTLRIELDKAGNVVRKHLIIGDYYYLVEGDDLVSAFVSDNDLEINDELYLMVLYLINGFEIGKIDDNQLFDYINSIKNDKCY